MQPHFNEKSEVNRDDKAKFEYTLTLTGTGEGATEKRAAALIKAITRWPQLKNTGDCLVSDLRIDQSDAAKGAQVKLMATEGAILDIYRQFSSDIMRVTPDINPIPPSRRPVPVDPFDVRFW